VVEFGQYLVTTNYYVQRCPIAFDTSIIPDNAVIDSVRITTVVVMDNSLTDFNVMLVAGSFAVPKVAASFNDFTGWAASGAYSLTNVFDGTWTTAGKSVGDSLTFHFNATGKAIVDKTGYTKVMMLSSRDQSATEPSGNEYIRFGSGNNANLYMKVSYTTPSITNTRAILRKDGITTPYRTDGGITPMKQP
jgi:hypothetical protein